MRVIGDKGLGRSVMGTSMVRGKPGFHDGVTPLCDVDARRIYKSRRAPMQGNRAFCQGTQSVKRGDSATQLRERWHKRLQQIKQLLV